MFVPIFGLYAAFVRITELQCELHVKLELYLNRH